MDAADRTEEYDFDDSCISAGDYFYIKTKEGEAIGNSKYEKFDDYYVYFYDTELATLFYIHSNICKRQSFGTFYQFKKYIKISR